MYVSLYYKREKKVKVKSLRLFVTLWTVACHAPLSMGFSRQEYWNGLPFPSPGDLPIPETEHSSPALQADSLPTELRWKLCSIITVIIEYLYLLML